MKTVLALDQSEGGNTGWAVVNDKGNRIDSGLINWMGAKTPRQRMLVFSQNLRLLLGQYNPDVFCTELVRQFHAGGINIKTIRRLSELNGIALLCVQRHNPDIAVWLVNTSTWKASILDKGNAPKSASTHYVKIAMNHDAKSDDEADALCIARYCSDMLAIGQPARENAWEQIL